MPDRENIIYQFDGSFDGLMCCVFESYDKKEFPSDIITDNAQCSFVPVKYIETDTYKSERVIRSIPKRMGHNAFEFIRNAYLTCHPEKYYFIFRFMQLGYKHGERIMGMLADEVVNTLFKAVKALNNETHLLKGFIRFSDYDGVLAAVIEPKNIVLPKLAHHFCERFPEENFIIYDKTNKMALVYKPYNAEIIYMDDLILPDADDKEKTIRGLWKLFYDTIEIKSRHNSKCRQSHMPKRYWKHMTEFSEIENKRPLIEEIKRIGE
jgi:probable DNA metabolism protein